jgi:hypothetical protein
MHLLMIEGYVSLVDINSGALTVLRSLQIVLVSQGITSAIFCRSTCTNIQSLNIYRG